MILFVFSSEECRFRASDRQDRADNACSRCQNKSIHFTSIPCPKILLHANGSSLAPAWAITCDICLNSKSTASSSAPPSQIPAVRVKRRTEGRGSNCFASGFRFLFPRNSSAIAKNFTSRGISAGFPCRGHKGTAKFPSQISSLNIPLSAGIPLNFLRES